MATLRRLLTLATAAAVSVTLTAGPASAVTDSGQEPSLQASATIGDEPAEAPGPELPEGLPATLAVSVTNHGADPLTGLTMVHGAFGALECPVTVLDPGGSTQCTVGFDAASGRHRSKVTATALLPGGAEVRAVIRIGYRGIAGTASLMVEPLVDGAAADRPGPDLDTGSRVDIVYRVSNTGTVPLTRLKVSDSGRRPISCSPRVLAPGETVDCTALLTVAEGRQNERVVAKAVDPLGEPVRDVSRFGYRGVDPVIEAAFTVVPLAGGVAASEAPGPRVPAGGPVTWGVEVANTGEDHLWGLYAWDTELGRIDCGEPHLAPGATTRCEIAGETRPGPMVGTVEVTAWATDGRRVEADVERHAFGFTAGPDVLIETYVDGFDADRHAGPRRVDGSTLTFTYVVTNTGTVGLAGVAVSDQRFGKVSCPGRRLSVGEAMTCRLESVAKLGWWETTGRVRARNGSEVVRSSDKTFWHVRPTARVSRLDVSASIGGLAAGGKPGPAFPAGDRVEVVLRAVNTGNSPLWSVELRHPDIRPEDLTCTGGPDLQVGEGMTCRGRVTVGEGNRIALVEAVGWNSDGTRIVGEVKLRYVGVAGLT